MTRAAVAIEPVIVPIDPNIAIMVVSKDELRDILFARKGCAFASIVAHYDMDEKDSKGCYKKWKVTGNPFIGKGIKKIAETQVMVTFDYDAALQRRTDGEESAKGGPTWQQAVLRDGKLTPLTVHKKDVLGYDDNGNPTGYREGCTLYLRSEFRSSKSRYVLPDNTEVEVETIKPFFKSTGSDGPVQFHTVSFDNIHSLTIDKQTYRVF